MIDALLSYIAPHYCYGCHKIGTILCDNCKYDIISEPYGRCIVCERPCLPENLCSRCRPPYQRAWCVGERTDELERLITDFKFQRVKAAHKTLAELVHQTLPELPSQTIIVPVPTVNSHIRRRGYDHTRLIARHLARLRGLEQRSLLERVTNTAQLGTSRQTRLKQARRAFRATQTLDSDVPYLLLDDVMTTGATIKYAAKALRAAGATTIWVATVSRQSDSGARVL